jgi:hypothetical protein
MPCSSCWSSPRNACNTNRASACPYDLVSARSRGIRARATRRRSVGRLCRLPQKLGVGCTPSWNAVQGSKWAFKLGSSTITATETVPGAWSASLRLEWTAKRWPEATYAGAMLYASLKGAADEARFVTRSMALVGDESRRS